MLVESDPVLMPGITTTTGQRAVMMEDHKPTPIKCLTLTRAPCAPRWRVKLHKDDGKSAIVTRGTRDSSRCYSRMGTSRLSR